MLCAAANAHGLRRVCPHAASDHGGASALPTAPGLTRAQRRSLRHESFERLVALLSADAPLAEDPAAWARAESEAKGDDAGDDTGGGVQKLQVRYAGARWGRWGAQARARVQVNQEALRSAWEATQRATKEDW